MADISVIKLPNGNSYNLKDTTARSTANSAVPNTRTVNGKALSSNISLGAGDVGAYTKKETDTKINAAIASAYKYKGSVTADKLPTSGQVVGDVYNITNDSSYGKAGMNVAWTGTTWDALGSNVDLSNYVTTSDSRLSNARPASDVYAWAKAAKKPSYSASEIGAAPASHNHDDRYEIAYRSNFASNGEYIRLGIATMRQQGDYLFIRVYSGSGYNGQITQDRAFDIHLRTSNGSGPLYAGYVEYHLNGSSNNDVYIVPNSSGTTYAIWIGLTSYSGNGFYIVEESNGAGWSNSQTTSNSIPSGAIKLTQKNIAYTSDIPTSLPANGGNSSTVNGHTVNADVPANAQFTDTTYGVATSSTDGLMSKADKAKLDGIGAGSNVKSVNGKTGAVTLAKGDVGLGNVANLDQSKAIKSITRSGTTFTATALDGTKTTFTQQDSNTTYGVASQSSNGLMSAADKKAVDREFFRMLPKGGTVIPNGANLNSTAYLKVGNYYQSANVNTTNMTNIPIKAAFMMYVLSPLSETYDNESTAQWVYRLRIFVVYTGNNIFVQTVSSGATPGSFDYGPWVKMTNSNDLGAVSKIINDHIANKANPHGVTKAQVGLGNVDNTADSAKSVKYAASAGSANSVAWSNVSGKPSSLPANGGNSSTVNGHTVNSDVPSGAKFTDTTYSAATQSANGLMSAADKKKLDSYTTGSAGGAVEVTLAAASWSSSTTEINGNNYYTYSVSVANIGNQHPQIFCGGGDSVIPSATQESEFNHIRYALVDTAKSTVTFYSIEKPSVAINVVIKDYLESSIVSGTASVTIATSDWSSTTSTVNGRAFYTAKKTLSSVSSNYPTIICGTADTLPSDAEQTAFDCINYAAADTSTKTVTFYAIQKPTSAVVAIVI